MNVSEKIKGHIAKVSSGVLVTPKRIITDSIASAARDVRDGSILRIRVSSTVYLAFGPQSLGAVSSSTQNAVELTAGTYLVSITGEGWVRASAAADRVEVIA